MRQSMNLTKKKNYVKLRLANVSLEPQPREKSSKNIRVFDLGEICISTPKAVYPQGKGVNAMASRATSALRREKAFRFLSDEVIQNLDWEGVNQAFDELEAYEAEIGVIDAPEHREYRIKLRMQAQHLRAKGKGP
jgi:hypothetical protein